MGKTESVLASLENEVCPHPKPVDFVVAQSDKEPHTFHSIVEGEEWMRVWHVAFLTFPRFVDLTGNSLIAEVLSQINTFFERAGFLLQHIFCGFTRGVLST